MILREALASGAYLALPRLSVDDVRWSPGSMEGWWDWWDGPVSGLVEHLGSARWVQAVFDEQADEWTLPRRFVVAALPPDVLAWVREQSDLFDTLEHEGQLDEYYRQGPGADFSALEAVAWFEEVAQPRPGRLGDADQP